MKTLSVVIITRNEESRLAEAVDSVAGVADEVLDVLMKHDYPGNARELENIIEHAFVMCRSGIIRKRHLPPQLLPAPPPAGDAPTSIPEAERAFLVSVLERNRWNRAATARELGIHKTTLWRKIRRLGIDLPKKHVT